MIAAVTITTLAVACGSPLPTTPSPAVATASPVATLTDNSARLLDQLETIALQPEDLAQLGPAFEPFDVGPTQILDVLPAPQSAPDRFGRIGGWKARYRQGPDVTTGILVIDSRIDLFPDAGAAASDLAAYAARYSTQAGPARATISTPSLGQGATMSTTVLVDQTHVRTATIAWRQGSFTGQVVASALGDVDPAAAAQMLAAAIDQRMSAATPGD